MVLEVKISFTFRWIVPGKEHPKCAPKVQTVFQFLVGISLCDLTESQLVSMHHNEQRKIVW